MGILRVHELAKKLGLSNSELIERLSRAGLTVRSHSSALDELDAMRALNATPGNFTPTATTAPKTLARDEPMVTWSPAKVRVHELARKLGMENLELVSRLQRLGMGVETHYSTIVEHEALLRLEQAEKTASRSGGLPMLFGDYRLLKHVGSDAISDLFWAHDLSRTDLQLCVLRRFHPAATTRSPRMDARLAADGSRPKLTPPPPDQADRKNRATFQGKASQHPL